jgi:enoyl-CoA hydratase
MGLTLECFDTYAEVMAHARETAKMIAAKSPLTIRGAKKTILYSRDNTVEESLDQVAMWNASHLYSNDLMEAMKAMMAKSDANYKDY